MTKAELAQEFRILMLSLGIDQQGTPENAAEWIEDHAKAIEDGRFGFYPMEKIMKCHVEGELVERTIHLTVGGIAYYRMGGNRLRDPGITFKRIY